MAKLSKRESWAARTGRPKEEYRSSAEGKETKAAKKYYAQKEEFADRGYDLDSDKLKKDFELVLEEAGFKKDWLMEDFTRNIKRLAEDKETDIEDLNYYLSTNRGRTQEDLDVSLTKELRSYNLNMDREAESLQERNLVFSGLGGVRGKEERQIKTEYQSNKEDFERTAKRSFQDLERLELVKTAAIEREYMRDVEDTTTTKERGIKQIDFGVKSAKQNKESSLALLNLRKEETSFDIEKNKQDSYSNIISRYNQQYTQEQYEKPLWNLLMS